MGHKNSRGKGHLLRKTQFQIEGGGLVQGVTKLITILLTFVSLN